MLRLYIRCGVILLLLFVLLAVTMSVLGSTQPIHPALRGFVEGCEGIPQPCWYGIVPGVTSRTSALETLRQVGYHVQDYTGSISDGSDGVLIGEAPSLVPSMVTYNNFVVYAINLSLNQWEVRIGDVSAPGGIFFQSGRVLLQRREENMQYESINDHLLTNYTQINILSLYISRWNTRETHMWQGFAPRWRYCQLSPATDTCQMGQ